jgi:hypothetical protein
MLSIKNLLLLKQSHNLDTKLGNHLQEHCSNYDEVLRELEGDLETLLATPYDRDKRFAYIRKKFPADLEPTELQEYISVLRDTLGAPKISGSFGQHLGTKSETFQRIQLPSSPDIPTILHNHPDYSTLIEALAPAFATMSEKHGRFLLKFVERFEDFSLVIFEPYIISFVGLLTFLKLAVSLHQKAAFIQLMKHLVSISQVTIPFYFKNLLLKISQSAFVGGNKYLFLLGATGLGIASAIAPFSTLFIKPSGSTLMSGELLDKLIGKPERAPEVIRNVLSGTKRLLEIAGAECYKISSAPFRGAALGFLDDNRGFLKEVLDRIGSKKS